MLANDIATNLHHSRAFTVSILFHCSLWSGQVNYRASEAYRVDAPCYFDIHVRHICTLSKHEHFRRLFPEKSTISPSQRIPACAFESTDILLTFNRMPMYSISLRSSRDSYDYYLEGRGNYFSQYLDIPDYFSFSQKVLAFVVQ